MLDSLIPNFEAEVAEIEDIARAGYILAFGISMKGPEFVFNRFDRKWIARYEQQSYFAIDPVFLWSIRNTGSIRWSDVRLPDFRGVMKEASAFGMKYGMTSVVKSGAKRSFLSAARADREFTDVEISHLAAKFSTWAAIVTQSSALTDRELDVLRGIRDGLGQREIADSLSIAESTVKQRALSACRKLNAKTRAQAVAIALTRNML